MNIFKDLKLINSKLDILVNNIRPKQVVNTNSNVSNISKKVYRINISGTPYNLDLKFDGSEKELNVILNDAILDVANDLDINEYKGEIDLNDIIVSNKQKLLNILKVKYNIISLIDDITVMIINDRIIRTNDDYSKENLDKYTIERNKTIDLLKKDLYKNKKKKEKKILND